MDRHLIKLSETDGEGLREREGGSRRSVRNLCLLPGRLGDIEVCPLSAPMLDYRSFDESGSDGVEKGSDPSQCCWLSSGARFAVRNLILPVLERLRPPPGSFGRVCVCVCAAKKKKQIMPVSSFVIDVFDQHIYAAAPALVRGTRRTTNLLSSCSQTATR